MTYSSSLSMGRQKRMKRNQNTVSFKPKEGTLGPVSNTIILIVLACLLGLLYLTQVTKTNAFGYEINALQREQQTLQTEYSELEVTSARLQALERVENSEQAQSLASVSPTNTIQN